MIETLTGQGPSGFIEVGQNLLVVDYGKVYQDGSPVGILFEDGLMQGMGEPLGTWEGLKTIEEFPGVVFRGIDSRGQPLELPGAIKGPTGGLTYNSQTLNVIFGRIATQDHRLIGEMSDDGTLSFRDPRHPGAVRKMDESSQLATKFQGIKSNGQPWETEYSRSLHRADKSYWENEIIRYFEDIDRLNSAQKKYIFETMRLFAQCGLLQLVRKTQGRAGLGNVKHGASGVTAIKSGHMTLDREEFEKEVVFYKKFGPFMSTGGKVKPFIEVRLNLVVAHEYGHQLEFCLSQAMLQRLNDIYERRLRICDRLHSLPDDYEGAAELLLYHQIEERIFISGYARSSVNEYFAESVAAFAIKESREILKSLDPDIHALLTEVVLEPEKALSVTHQEVMLNLQTSLRVGGEMSENILEI